ncbi:HIT family protein [Streptomyces sp. NPDC058286]|uniref:HIT family protein n=1 Tax=Streptomyces sp. NPDC058286 TaxID=3346422 RepID=UPI0036EFC981
MRDYVLNTPGARGIIDDAVHEVTALRAATDGLPVQLLVNCWYGRHRAPAIADAIGDHLRKASARAQVTHRHINRPPVPRKPPRPDCPFCRIVHGQAPALIVQECPDALAIRPRADEHGRRGCTAGHLLVIPRGHVAEFTTDPVVSATGQLRAAELAAQIGGQWNYLTSCGPDATQTVFHPSTATSSPEPPATASPSWTRPTHNQETA